MQRGLQAQIPGIYLQFLPPELANNARDYFAYPIDFTATIAGPGSATATQSFNDDSWFLQIGINGRVTSDANFETVIADPAATIRLEDESAGRNLQAAPIAYANTVGTAQLPYFLPYPKLWTRGAVAALTLANLGATAFTSARFSLYGFKIFTFSWAEAGVY